MWDRTATQGLPVLGSVRALMKSHYDRRGVDPAFARILVQAGAGGLVACSSV